MSVVETPRVGRELRWAVDTVVAAEEAPFTDVPTPGEIRGAGLLLLLGLILLSPDTDGEPVDPDARVALQDIAFADSL